MLSAQQRVRAQCEAMLLQPMMQPLEQAFGEFGDVATQAWTDVLARCIEAKNG